MNREIRGGLTAICTAVAFLVPGAASAVDWTGTYVGSIAGVVISKGTITIDYNYDPFFTVPESVPIPGIGGLVGVTVGHDIQNGQWVFGVIGDASLVGLTGHVEGEGYEYDARLDSLLTLRGRAGYAVDKWMFYVTGGVAAGSGSFTARVFDFGKGLDPDPAHASGLMVGGVAGAGAEYAFNDQISLKAEALIFCLSPLSGVGDTGKGTYTATYKPAGTIFQTGINFHF